MGNYLNIGNDGFKSITKGIYIDKTEMIAFINGTLGTADKLTCVSRPRRFGKSFAAKMLCAYYDKSCNSESLFANYKIASDLSFKKHLNRYDVIYLDITWFISITGSIKEDGAISQIKTNHYPEALQDYGREILLAGINYDVKSQKHTCKIERLGKRI